MESFTGSPFIHKGLSTIIKSVSLLVLVIGMATGLMSCENSSIQSHGSGGDISLKDQWMTPSSSEDEAFVLDQDAQVDLDKDRGSDSELITTFEPPPHGFPLFRFPIAERDISLINPHLIFGVDHDDLSGQRIRCLNYEGLPFPRCYDDHQGSDFLLINGFMTMDSGSATVVAALGGTVLAAVDGNYDRCHADIASADVSCDGYPMRPNYISLRHEGGWESHYYHLKRESVLVDVGDQVSCGQALALVGSSGYSSMPHLHFELNDALGNIWDPYAGTSSQVFSFWTDQVSSLDPESLPSTSCSSP